MEVKKNHNTWKRIGTRVQCHACQKQAICSNALHSLQIGKEFKTKTNA